MVCHGFKIDIIKTKKMKRWHKLNINQLLKKLKLLGLLLNLDLIKWLINKYLMKLTKVLLGIETSYRYYMLGKQDKYHSLNMLKWVLNRLLMLLNVAKLEMVNLYHMKKLKLFTISIKLMLN